METYEREDITVEEEERIVVFKQPAEMSAVCYVEALRERNLNTEVEKVNSS